MATTITFANLLGSLLSDIVGGEQQAAFNSLSLIKDIGFIPDGKSDSYWGRLRLITFNFEGDDPNSPGKSITRKIQIPLLSLVPISLISFDEIELEFAGQVLDFNQKKSSSDIQSIGQFKFENFDIMMALDKPDPAKKTMINVKLKIKSSDFPGGINHLLQVLDLNAKEAK